MKDGRYWLTEELIVELKCLNYALDSQHLKELGYAEFIEKIRDSVREELEKRQR